MYSSLENNCTKFLELIPHSILTVFTKTAMNLFLSLLHLVSFDLLLFSFFLSIIVQCTLFPASDYISSKIGVTLI